MCTVCRRRIDNDPTNLSAHNWLFAYLLYIDGSRLSKDRAYIRVPFAFLDSLSITHSFLFEESSSSESRVWYHYWSYTISYTISYHWIFVYNWIRNWLIISIILIFNNFYWILHNCWKFLYSIRFLYYYYYIVY